MMRTLLAYGFASLLVSHAGLAAAQDFPLPGAGGGGEVAAEAVRADAERQGIGAATALTAQQPWRREKPPPFEFPTGPAGGLELDDAGNPIEKPAEADAEEQPS